MIGRLKNTFCRVPLVSGENETINLPNAITLLRIGVIPVLFFLLAAPGEMWSFIIAVIFICAALTDLLDGYIARRYQIVTTMGKFLDPVADKIIVNTAMILMIPIGRIQAWIVAIIIIRDFVVDGMRSIASSEGVVIDASGLGKQKMLCQIIAVSALIIHYPIWGINAHIVGSTILYFALLLTLFSGADYAVKFYQGAIRKSL